MIVIISASNLVRIYPGDIRAVDGISFSMQANDYIAITGPSGCGKSTLL
ncbi:ATP-binding cassette domain-containing protein, partial [bacterium]|nr:ATP-binding cassette domain-containing protein [bacterium]